MGALALSAGGSGCYDKPTETAETSAARDMPVELITRSCI
jgi:hypothetical protein